MSVAIQMTLSLAEIDELHRHESIIESGLQTFVEVGTSLLVIRDGRLYRTDHGTFEDYCRDRWGITDRRARQLMTAAEVVSNFETGTIVPKPENEAQARPLARLQPGEQVEAFEEARQASPTGRPTAKEVEAVVERRIPRPAPRPSQPSLLDDPEEDDRQQRRVESRRPDPAPSKRETEVESPKVSAEHLRQHFLKSVSSVDDLTRAAAAQVIHGGYGGLPAVLKLLGRSEGLRLGGKVETLVERLQEWRTQIREYYGE